MSAEAAAEERKAIVAYLRDRARWLRAEVKAGADTSLQMDANQCDVVAGLIAGGRHYRGGHIR